MHEGQGLESELFTVQEDCSMAIWASKTFKHVAKAKTDKLKFLPNQLCWEGLYNRNYLLM